MTAKCTKCLRTWNISTLQKIPRSGYICPQCGQKKRKEAIAKKIMAAAVALPYSAFITYIAGKWMIESAAKFRGYDAIGGEYIVAVIIFAASFWLVWKVLGGDRGQE